jgi:uncharacterized protein (DUF1800 family)
MSLSRRDFLKIAGLLAANTALASCSPIYEQLAGTLKPPGSPVSLPPGVYPALSRLTFGPSMDERDLAAEIGLKAWIEEQLASEKIDNSPAAWRIRRLDVLELSAGQLRDRADKLFDDYDASLVVDDFRQATLLRQIFSRRQLYEVMVEFWSDHFNISMEKGDCWFLKIVDDREVIRQHALGKFRDLLQASAHSPAMLVYLDNQSNVKDAPNENYAREVMELHTLGVDGGYDQQDVMELARCLTGWTVKESFHLGEFTFDETVHDPGAKQVLGYIIQSNGQSEAEAMLDRLARDPATAHHIATKLVRRFIADDPPKGLVERATRTFNQTDGDIKSVLRSILLDSESPSGSPLSGWMQPKFKRPVNFIVSSLRMLGAETDGGRALHDHLSLMGQRLFAWPTPDGYPDTASAWMGNLLPRWKFAIDLAANQINGTQIDLAVLLESTGASEIETILDSLHPILLGAPMPIDVRDTVAQSLRDAGAGDDLESASIILAGILASPAYQWR